MFTDAVKTTTLLATVANISHVHHINEPQLLEIMKAYEAMNEDQFFFSVNLKLSQAQQPKA